MSALGNAPSPDFWARQVHPLPPEVNNQVGGFMWFRGPTAEARKSALLRDRALPGDPGQNKTSLRFELHDGRLVRVIRSKSSRAGDRIRVCIYPTDAEMAERKRDICGAFAAEALSRLPATEAAFRARAETDFLNTYLLMKSCLFPAGAAASGFAFDVQLAEDFDRLAGRMLYALRDAAVTLNKQRQAIAAAAATAQFDGPLQRLLGSAVRAATRASAKPQGRSVDA